MGRGRRIDRLERAHEPEAFPSITIGGGGRGTDAHALSESFDTTDSWMGTQNALLLTIALAQK